MTSKTRVCDELLCHHHHSGKRSLVSRLDYFFCTAVNVLFVCTKIRLYHCYACRCQAIVYSARPWLLRTRRRSYGRLGRCARRSCLTRSVKDGQAIVDVGGREDAGAPVATLTTATVSRTESAASSLYLIVAIP